MLSNTTKHAIRTLIYLELFSTHEKKAGIKQISGDLDIPSPFLAKILQVLVKHDFLDSVKGPHGGFSMKRAAIETPLIDVIDAIEGTAFLSNCVIRTTSCDHSNPCSLHHKLAPIQLELRSLYATETIADLVSEFREGREQIRI
jgi:Rrf2 family iron-sulfur cluster assembly transcriptional regulator